MRSRMASSQVQSVICPSLDPRSAVVSVMRSSAARRIPLLPGPLVILRPPRSQFVTGGTTRKWRDGLGQKRL